MCAAPAMALCVLLMALTARGEIHNGDQEEHPKQSDHHAHEYVPELYSQHQLSERENHPDHYAQEQLPEHYAQDYHPEHYAQEHPEHATDHHKHQPQYEYKHEEQQPEHQYVHHDLAKSYQNFNLHVGPQQIVRIPVHRHPTGHNELQVFHEYPSRGVSDTSKPYQHQVL